MNKYMFIQQWAKFRDKKRILGVDFGENVEFVLIPCTDTGMSMDREISLSLAKSTYKNKS